MLISNSERPKKDEKCDLARIGINRFENGETVEELRPTPPHTMLFCD